jgi:tetratricopeptide (TPR) repeat protein
VDKAQREAENRANLETQGAFNAGVTAFEGGNLDEAIKQFSLAAERRPKMYVIFARLAAVYSEAERYNEATDAHKKAAELKPDDSWFFYNMGLSACRANRMDECRGGIAKSVELEPTRGAAAYFNLGSMLAAKGMGKEADEAFQKSVAYNPNNAETQYQIGLLYLKEASTIPNAIPYFEKYLKLAPAGPYAATVKQMLETVNRSK